MIYFLDFLLCPNYFLKLRFGDWAVSPSSGKKPALLGSIGRASPYLRDVSESVLVSNFAEIRS
jgi:hypothetical protein